MNENKDKLNKEQIKWIIEGKELEINKLYLEIETIEREITLQNIQLEELKKMLLKEEAKNQEGDEKLEGVQSQ